MATVWILFVGAKYGLYEAERAEWKKHNGECRAVDNIADALREIAARQFQLIVVIIQKDAGQDMLRHIAVIRGMTTAPIIASTGEAFDLTLRIQALEVGADQFHVMPLSVEERVTIGRSLVRRYLEFNKHSEPPVTVFLRKHITISVEQRIVFVDQREVELLPKEFDILCLLIKYPGHWYTAEQIYNSVWNDTVTLNAKDVVRKQIYNLREKLQIHPNLPKLILSQRGNGYQFNPNCNMS